MPNPDRFAKFADTLALVLQHPATPVRNAHLFQMHLLPIAAMLAGIAPDTITAPRPNAARLNPHALFLDFALAVADVLDDDDLNAGIWNEIGDCTGEVEELLKPENVQEAEAARMRGVVKEWARVQGLAVDTKDQPTHQAWDFSKAFTFDPAEKPEVGDLVLIQRGQSLTITPYDGRQSHLGAVVETEVMDCTGGDDEEITPASAPDPADEAAAHKCLDEANERYLQDRERFVAAVWQRLSPEENEQAWRDYSALCAKVITGGRLWTVQFVWILAPIFRLIEEDMEASANEAANGYPTLEALARIVEVLALDDEHTGRRLAGYLDAAAQPFPVAA